MRESSSPNMTKKPNPRLHAPKMPKTKRRFNFFRRDPTYKRSHVRHPCFCLGTLNIVGTAHSLDGVITNISSGGLQFRPATSYILQRKGDEILCVFADLRITGKITSTTLKGYGVVFHSVLDEEAFINFTREFLHQGSTADALNAMAPKQTPTHPSASKIDIHSPQPDSGSQ